MTLAEAILAFNRPYSAPLRGAVIHKIDEATAKYLAPLIHRGAGVLQPAMPILTFLDALTFLCAVIGQESRFDPAARNHNFTPIEAILYLLGQKVDLDKGDYGIGQFKLKYIRQAADAPELHGLLLNTVIENYLSNPAWAVPLVARRYATLLKHAHEKYPELDARWTASGCYNRGVTGFAQAYADQTSPAWAAATRHMNRVKEHDAWFNKNLNPEEGQP